MKFFTGLLTLASVCSARGRAGDKGQLPNRIPDGEHEIKLDSGLMIDITDNKNNQPLCKNGDKATVGYYAYVGGRTIDMNE